MRSIHFERTAKIFISSVMITVTSFMVIGAVSYFYFSHDLPSVENLKNYKPPTITKFFSGEIIQGGSTITQQVVKSLLLTPEKSLTRKIREAILAFKIEKYLSKEEILHLYLNQIYLGHGAYGVAVAAENYFGKSIEELNLAESALLAGLPQAPSKYSPHQHPEQAKKRQIYILNRMVEEGFISYAESLMALQAPIKIKGKQNPSFEKAPHFVEHVRRYVEERYGKNGLYKR